jgi:hypothetical protein
MNMNTTCGLDLFYSGQEGVTRFFRYSDKPAVSIMYVNVLMAVGEYAGLSC